MLMFYLTVLTFMNQKVLDKQLKWVLKKFLLSFFNSYGLCQSRVIVSQPTLQLATKKMKSVQNLFCDSIKWLINDFLFFFPHFRINIPRKKLLIVSALAAIVVVALFLGLYFGLKQVEKELEEQYGGVTSNGIECAHIGANILKKQGSAADAAIATLFCEGIACPQSMGLGGGFLLTMYHKESGIVETMNARESAPIHATEDMYVDNPSLAMSGGLAIGRFNARHAKK
jgi:hypothetical protein